VQIFSLLMQLRLQTIIIIIIVTDTGTVADMAATRKTEKYLTLSSAYRFEPI